MARILIGNIKGPQGAQGIQGPQGPVGATGPQGPMPDLINNALATQAGVAALDAVMGKTLQDQITQLNSDKFDKSGGTLSGENLYIGGGHGRFGGSSAELALQAWNTKLDTSNLRGILIRNSSRTSHVADSLIYRDRIDNVDKDYRLYGEHNKPSGSYTGNGSAETRQINTGGLGNVIYIVGNGYGLFVTQQGAVVFAYDDRDIEKLPNTDLFFSNGVITIASDHPSVNTNGCKYDFQVL